jgi:hypothetical protein
VATPLLLALPVLVACGGKKAAPAASADAGGQAREAVTGDYPSDAKSQAFVEGLASLTIENFAAVDGGGARVILGTLRFSGDNTWSASGYVDAGEERMECTERGTWTMEPAESATVATITWAIGSTDCVGREVGTDTRAKVTIEGDDVEIAFR